MLQQLARDLFGAQNVNVDAPVVPRRRRHDRRRRRCPTRACSSSRWSSSCVIAIAIYMQRTPAGRRMRAVMQNRPLASVSRRAHDARRPHDVLHRLGPRGPRRASAITLLGPVGPTLGLAYIIDAFLVVIVGGLGQLRGAIIAALALGMANSFIEYNTTTSIAKAGVFLLIVAVPAVAPAGHDRPAAPGAADMSAIAKLAARRDQAARASSRASRSWRPRCCCSRPPCCRTSACRCSRSSCASRSSRSASASRGARAACSCSARGCSSGSAATAWACT